MAMTTVHINLPDDQAAALQAKAAAHGMTLEDWISRKLAEEAPTGRNHYTLSELMEQCDLNAPLSDDDLEWLNAPAMGREAL
jgi:hypothetical protein